MSFSDSDGVALGKLVKLMSEELLNQEMPCQDALNVASRVLDSLDQRSFPGVLLIQAFLRLSVSVSSESSSSGLLNFVETMVLQLPDLGGRRRARFPLLRSR